MFNRLNHEETDSEILTVRNLPLSVTFWKSTGKITEIKRVRESYNHLLEAHGKNILGIVRDDYPRVFEQLTYKVSVILA